jgi:hypothetical protein
LTGDIPATARWAGNSAAVISRYYLGKGTPEDAHSFYAMKPTSGKIVGMTLNPQVMVASALPQQVAGEV